MEREDRSQKAEQVTIPVVEEELQVGKRRVETGVTRVIKRVSSTEQEIREPLEQQTAEIEHVPINRFVDGPVETRTEGDVVIVPVLEEVLVVEKKLRLKEEIHISRRTATTMSNLTEDVRTEEVVVEHEDLSRREE